MKRKFLLSFSAGVLALAQAAFGQVSPTDRLAVDSGVSLWLSAWKATAKTDLAKLQPLYLPSVVTDSRKQSWGDFAKLVQNQSSHLRTLIAGQAEDARVSVDHDRLVALFPSSGIRLVWEKVNGVWKIAEQNFPTATAAN